MKHLIFIGLCTLGLSACLGPDTFQKVSLPNTEDVRRAYTEIRDDIRHYGYSCGELKIVEKCLYPAGAVMRYSCGSESDPAKIYADEIYTADDDDRGPLPSFHRVGPYDSYKTRRVYARWKSASNECPADPFVNKPISINK